jgi:heat shock protein HslJ
MRSVVTMVLALCALAAPALASPLNGKSFETVRIGTNGVTSEKTPTLTVDAGRASGTGGCNNFGATVQDLGRLTREVRNGRAHMISKGALRFGSISATRIFCGPGSAQEARFFAALDQVRFYRLGRSELRLYAGGARPRLLIVMRRKD